MPHRLLPAVHWLLRTFDPWYGWAAGVGVPILIWPSSEMLVWPLGVLVFLMSVDLFVRHFSSQPLPKGYGRPDRDDFIQACALVAVVLAIHTLAWWANHYGVPGIPAWVGIGASLVGCVVYMRRITQVSHVRWVSPAFAALEAVADRLMTRHPHPPPRRRRPPPA